MKLTTLILVCLTCTGLYFVSSITSPSLEATNKMMPGFLDPLFDFLKSMFSAIIDFFQGVF